MRREQDNQALICWRDAFRVLRGVDRDPTDEERMIFNLANSKGMTFEDATRHFLEAMAKTLSDQGALHGALTYDPETGRIVEVAIATEAES